MPFLVLAMGELNKICIYKTSSTLLGRRLWDNKRQGSPRKLGFTTSNAKNTGSGDRALVIYPDSEVTG